MNPGPVKALKDSNKRVSALFNRRHSFGTNNRTSHFFPIFLGWSRLKLKSMIPVQLQRMHVMTIPVAIDVPPLIGYLVWTVNGALVMQNSHSTNWWIRSHARNDYL
jgi:hypothetical protein